MNRSLRPGGCVARIRPTGDPSPLDQNRSDDSIGSRRTRGQSGFRTPSEGGGATGCANSTSCLREKVLNAGKTGDQAIRLPVMGMDPRCRGSSSPLRTLYATSRSSDQKLKIRLPVPAAVSTTMNPSPVRQSSTRTPANPKRTGSVSTKTDSSTSCISRDRKPSLLLAARGYGA